MTTTPSNPARGRGARRAVRLLSVAVFVVLMAACGGNSAYPPTRPLGPAISTRSTA